MFFLPLLSILKFFSISKKQFRSEVFMETENSVGSYIIIPREWERSCTFLRIVFNFIFALVDLYATFRKYIRKNTRKDDSQMRTRMTVSSKTCAKIHESQDALMKWLPVWSDLNCSLSCSSIREMLQYVFIVTSYTSFCKRCARIIINNADLCAIDRIAETVRIIKKDAEKSVKFRYAFKDFIRFLNDIERADATAFSEFMKALALEALQLDNSIYLDYWAHFVQVFCKEDKTEYETKLAILSMFNHEGAGLERYLLKGGWRNPRDTNSAGLTLLKLIAVPKCTMNLGSSDNNDIVGIEFTRFDRILFAPQDRPFVRYGSRIVSKRSPTFKARVMYDVAMNCCLEYISSSWSNERIERAVWALEYGLKHVSGETYEDLQSMHGKHKLDLTGFEPLSLLSFSICGLVYFQGRNESGYKLTGDPLAPIVVNGSLPKPSVKDFVELKLLKEVRNGRYTPHMFPGRSKFVKATHVGNTLRLMESVQAAPFDANPEQVIC